MNNNDAFISYSRKDKEFVKALDTAFKKNNREIWVDWEDIPLGADFLKEIYSGIEAANNFVFIISPDSVASEYCGKEIVHAIEQNKRLIPILRREVDPKTVHPKMAALNWIFFRENDDFDQAFQSLLKAIDTDLEYIKAHTRLQIRALEWDQKKRNPSRLDSKKIQISPVRQAIVRSQLSDLDAALVAPAAIKAARSKLPPDSCINCRL